MGKLSINEGVDSCSAPPFCNSPAAVMFSSRGCVPHVLDWHFKGVHSDLHEEVRKRASDAVVRVEKRVGPCDVAGGVHTLYVVRLKTVCLIST